MDIICKLSKHKAPLPSTKQSQSIMAASLEVAKATNQSNKQQSTQMQPTLHEIT
jgi:hypothetical protein